MDKKQRNRLMQYFAFKIVCIAMVMYWYDWRLLLIILIYDLSATSRGIYLDGKEPNHEDKQYNKKSNPKKPMSKFQQRMYDMSQNNHRALSDMDDYEITSNNES